jgi:hypothetical protein
MADKTPIRGAYNASSALTGLAEYATSETVGVPFGGTGATSLTDDGILLGNAAAAVQATAALTTNGQVVVGGTSGPAVANIAGTTDEVDITNGDGTITVGLSTSYSPAAVLQRAVATGKDITAKTAENASKIILVDLTDPATMWDVEAFLAATRFTSWRVELGSPPIRGAMFLNNANTELHWWNLDTDAAYMQFDVGGSNNDDNNMIYLTSNKPTDIYFLDGKIYFGTAGGGLWIIDFLQDECIGWFQSGQRRYEGNIEERNDGKGNISTNTSFVLLSNTVNAIAAVRDPSLVDGFDRPKHWWAIATNIGTGGGSGNVYNPVNDAIYTSTMGSDLDAIAMSQSGKMWWMRDNVPDAVYGYNIYSVYASGLGASNYMPQANWNGGSIGNSGSAVIVDLAAFDAPNGFDGLAVATNAGLDLGFMTGTTATTQDTDSAHIFITSTYQTPYMKGTRHAAYPLEGLTDRSGNGYTLANGNSVVFTGTSPFGLACSAFTRGSDMGLNDATNSPTVGSGGSFTVSVYFKSSTAFTNDGPIWTNAYSSMYCAMTIDSGQAQKLRWVTQSDSGGGSNIDQHSGGAVNDGEWHHGVGVLDADKGLQLLYLDGVLVASSAWTKTYVYTSTNGHSIGGKLGWWTDTFDGNIAQVSLCESAWTPNEVQLEYQRMVRGVGGATATLANTDVKSVRVDQNTGLAAVTTAANQVEIWNVNLGLRESINATSTATLNDADVRLPEGADEPLIAMGRSGQIGVVAPDRRLLG